MKNVAFVCGGIRGIRNKTQFQRANYICKNFNTYFFSLVSVCEEVTEKAEEAKCCPGGISYLKYIVFPLWAWLAVLKLNREKGVNLVYTNYFTPALIAGFLLKKSGFKWVADIWDDPHLPLRGGKGLKKFMMYLYFSPLYYIAKKNLKLADLVILVSPSPPEVLDGYDISPDKMLIVTNGVDLSITSPKEAPIQEDHFTITYVGHLKEIVGIGNILSAATLLKGKIPHFQILLIGFANRDDQNWMEKTIREKGLKEVKILGELEHEKVLEEIARSDVCLSLFPKVREYDHLLPVKIFEYMAMGKAILATRLKGTSTIIEDGETGLLVEPENPQAMAEAILRLYRDSSLRVRIGENAQVIVKKYSWEDINNRIGEALNAVIG